MRLLKLCGIGLTILASAAFLSQAQDSVSEVKTSSALNQVVYQCPLESAGRICLYDIETETESVIFDNERSLFVKDRIVLNGDQVLFPCSNREQEPWLRFCTINTDGSNLQEHHARPYVRDKYFKGGYDFTSDGRVAYVCSPYRKHIDVICAADKEDPNGFKVVSPRGYHALSMDMNDDGEIAFVCSKLFIPDGTRNIDNYSSPFQLCKVNLDGTGFGVVTPPEIWPRRATIMDTGEILSRCNEMRFSAAAPPPPDYEFCHIDPSGSLTTINSPLPVRSYYPMFMENGDIIFECSRQDPSLEDETEYGLCRMNVRSTDVEFNKLLPAWDGHIARNSEGLMVTICDAVYGLGRENYNSLCIFDKYGNDLHRVAEPKIWRGLPEIN